jgi:glutathione S-transferase
MSNIRLTAFQRVPPLAQGLVRDLPVRWALEEAGISYAENLIPVGQHKSAMHRELQPFGQIPVYEEDGLTLFESGAIVMHIGERCPALVPCEPSSRARVRTWMFAALNSVEPHVQNLATIDLFFANEDWARARRPGAEQMARQRLDAVAAALGDRDYLEGGFSAADLLMVSVLRILRHTRMVADDPVLSAYQARCEARPAFRRALAAQLAPFARYAPAA